MVETAAVTKVNAQRATIGSFELNHGQVLYMIAIEVADCERNCGRSRKVLRVVEGTIAPAQENANLGGPPVSHGQIEIAVLIEISCDDGVGQGSNIVINRLLELPCQCDLWQYRESSYGE